MDRSHRVDIRGWNLLKTIDFWQLFAIMGILAGIGLMTIEVWIPVSAAPGNRISDVFSSNIGHDVNALWKHYDTSVSEEFLVQHQQMHVSILSVGSFLGRMLSGEQTFAFWAHPADIGHRRSGFVRILTDAR